MRLVALAVLAALANPTAQAARVSVFGDGAGSSCGNWLGERSKGADYPKSNWILGYISGAVSWGGLGNPLGVTDPDGVLFWLEKFCRANPAAPFSDAADNFIRTFRD